MINLHGEGGIGKTRLAQATCDTLKEYGCFRGGIFEIDCEKDQDTQRLALSILNILGLGKKGEMLPDPVSMLPLILKEISEKNGKLLLMLDNVDSLFSSEGDSLEPHPAILLREILTECEEIRILSTCRTRLNLGAYEADFIVDPLNDQASWELFIFFLPDRDIREQVSSLFNEEKALLGELIYALNGHPLSIFLAAQRIGTSHDPIAQQIHEAHDKMMALLQSPALKGRTPRQKSLQASLDISYAQLSEKAQALFRKSSFFPGGIYRSADTLNPLLGEDWREIIQETVDLGLCRFEHDEQRYWMLNPVRTYAEDKLLNEEKENFYREAVRHWSEFVMYNDFFLNPAQSPETMAQLGLPDDSEERGKIVAQMHVQAFILLMAEETNILYAFQWALEHDFDSGEKIASGLIDYLKLSDKRQTNAWIALKVYENSLKPEMRAKWAGTLGNRLSDLGDREAALEKTEEALTIYRELTKKHPEAKELVREIETLKNRLLNSAK